MTFHLHLVSDSTGETINSVARACLAQFDAIDHQQHIWNMIRSPRLLQIALEGIGEKPGLVLYTIVDDKLRFALEDFCRDRNIPCVSVLRPVLKGMMTYFGQVPKHMPGKQHVLDDSYFARIDAMDYAMAQDDGQGIDRLQEADVLILGVSRTSKTPTCIYLAGRGVRAANIPLVPGIGLQVDVTQLTKPLIVGLTKDPESLVAIRRSRLKLLSENHNTDYVDLDHVRAEVTEARRLFARLNCPVIDVSRRSIEETAAEIMMLLSYKREKKADA